jgi:hypothetical protein
VHLPEAVQAGGSLGRSGCGQGVRVDPGQREMPEGEVDTVRLFCLDASDRPVRLARIRAFVIAVLDDQTTSGRSANVIDALVHRLNR